MSHELKDEEIKFLKKLEPTLKSKFIITASDKQYSEENDRLSSKIGGVPYWPLSKKGLFPKINGKYAKLIFQLNLNELSKDFDVKQISPSFPERGILQFYLAYQDELYGLYDDNNKPVVIYHENIDEESFITDEQKAISLDNEKTPFNSSVRVKFEESSELLGPQDEFYQQEFKELFTGVDTDDEEFMQFYYEYDEFDNSGSKVGGYAYFTQSDPFINLEDDNKLVLLLQLDSNSDDLKMSWGDSGVANWRIFEKDLANLDFSNLVYTWDCG